MKRSSYIARYLQFSNKVEKWLIKLLLVAIVLLFIAQLLLQNDTIRYWISRTERMEGIKVSSAQTADFVLHEYGRYDIITFGSRQVLHFSIFKPAQVLKR